MNEQMNRIKRMMRNLSDNGKYKVDIGVPSLGESTIVTVKGKDFRAEQVIFTNEEVFVEGHFNGKSARQSVRLDSIDESSLPRLAWGIETVMEAYTPDYY